MESQGRAGVPAAANGKLVSLHSASSGSPFQVCHCFVLLLLTQYSLWPCFFLLLLIQFKALLYIKQSVAQLHSVAVETVQSVALLCCVVSGMPQTVETALLCCYESVDYSTALFCCW